MSKTKPERQDKNSNAKEPTLEEVERRMKSIMAENDTPVYKTQEFFKLMKYIGLPTHSADIHCTSLTYPEMFEQAQKWIQNKLANQYTRKMVWAAWFSALMALVAVLISIFAVFASIYIYSQAQ